MKKYVIFAALTALFFSCNESSAPEPANPPNLRTLSAAELKVAAAGNEFAFDLYRNVQSNEPENTFISPLSVGYALGMAMNGAADDTRQSILNTIDFGNLTAEEVNAAYRDLTSLLLSMDNKTKLGIANSVWGHNYYSINPTFSDIINSYYDGEVQALDFANPETKNNINEWVSDKTYGKIKNPLESISPDEVMFLINALYFKSNWSYQFDKEKTHKADFTKPDGSTTEVDMMFAEGVSLSLYEDEHVRLIDIPYGNGQFRMTILVPRHDETIANLVEDLSASALAQWLADSDTLSCELELPKFKMTWKKDLKGILQQMGMQTVGFPHFFSEPLELAISRVIHQSFVEVNEEGAEAAAVTIIGIELTSTGPQPFRITIDEPFLFLIREKHSGVVLFIGQLVDPDALP